MLVASGKHNNVVVTPPSSSCQRGLLQILKTEQIGEGGASRGVYVGRPRPPRRHYVRDLTFEICDVNISWVCARSNVVHG